MPDADIKTIIPFVRQGCFGMTGQRCLGSDNVMVVGDIYDEFKQRFADGAKAMKLGYGLDESTDMGPYCTAAGRDKVAAWVERGLAAGATVVHDGRILAPDLSKGAFYGANYHRERSSGYGNRQRRSLRSGGLTHSGEQPRRSHPLDQYRDRSGAFGLHHDGER